MYEQCSGTACGPVGCQSQMGSCPCQYQDSCQSPTTCSCGCGASENCKGGDLLDTVTCAKKSLLKDKIKERLEKKMGKKLDAIADLAVEMLMSKYEMKKVKMTKKMEMMEKMKKAMGE